MKPSKIYGEENIEDGAIRQYEEAMALPWVTAGALMPDAHLGYSLPIGGVVATDNVVVPAWVGYDKGCGVCALPTSWVLEDIESFKYEILAEIFKEIPVGFSHNSRPVTWREYANLPTSMWFNEMFHDKGGLKQLGTLGGGNHFIEVGVDYLQEERIWIIIHSGSRNVGHSTATHYMQKACFLHTGKRKAREGHYGFECDSPLGRDYLQDLAACEAFALKNREEMLKRTMTAIQRYVDGEADWDGLINRTHNHVEILFEFGVVHRKGATHAKRGMYGVVPGNSRDGSFIVRGLGATDSLYSSSHGAGRVLSRKKAKETLDLDTFVQDMAGVASKVYVGNLDESPRAYKDIFEVMGAQEDLVEIIAHIKPIICVKG